MRQPLTGNETEHNTDQDAAPDVQGGPPVPAPSVTEEAQALRTICSWCEAEGRSTVIVDGPLDDQGRASHGICTEHAVKQTAEILAQIVVYPPLHVIPAQDRIGGYIIRDDRDRLIVDHLSGVNSAAAIAHILNNAIHGFGLCLLHLNEKRPDGTCFGCAIGVGRHPFSAVGR